MNKNICVYCSSSNLVPDTYKQAAQQLGVSLGMRGYNLVFGGNPEGLMDVIAKATSSTGGQIIAVVPKKIADQNKVHPLASSVIYAHNIAHRKAQMLANADAFMCLPGGFGTLDELFGTIMQKLVGEHKKPIILLNISGYYNSFIEQVKQSLQEQFVSLGQVSLFEVAPNVESAMELLDRAILV